MNANEKERWRFSQKRKVFTEYSWKNIFNGNHRGHGIFDSRGGWYLFSESKQPESWRMNLDESDQYENQSLDTSYLYFLEDSYLADIVKNMESMEADAVSAKQAAGLRRS